MRYLSTTEFAERLGVNPQTVRLWDKLGKLEPHHKTPGGKRLYSEEQLNGIIHPAVVRIGGNDVPLTDFDELDTCDIKLLYEKLQELLQKAENK